MWLIMKVMIICLFLARAIPLRCLPPLKKYITCSTKVFLVIQPKEFLEAVSQFGGPKSSDEGWAWHLKVQHCQWFCFTIKIGSDSEICTAKHCSSETQPASSRQTLCQSINSGVKSPCSLSSKVIEDDKSPVTDWLFSLTEQWQFCGPLLSAKQILLNTFSFVLLVLKARAVWVLKHSRI